MYYINIMLTLVLTLFIFIDKTWSSCILKVSSEFGPDAPQLTNEIDKKTVYPEKEYPTEVRVQVNDKLVANCPKNSLKISGTSINKPYIALTCVGDSSFKLPDGKVYKFKDIRCSELPKITVRQTGKRCSTGNIIEMGFESIGSSFITLIEICFNKDAAVTYWAHSRITSAIFNNEDKIKTFYNYRYKTAQIPADIDIVIAYIRDEARKTLLEIMHGNQQLVDKYIQKGGTMFLARGLLIPRAMMFYYFEQFSVFHYINVVPIWQTINDGNWKAIEEETRKIARNTGDVEVYSGGLYTLELPFSSTDSREIFLTRNKKTGSPAVFVPRLLFQLVYNPKQNRAIVYITINNPHIPYNNIPGNYMICREFKQCSLKNVTTAKNVKRGFSYCCLYDDFIKDAFAQRIGLPKLSNVEPLYV